MLTEEEDTCRILFTGGPCAGKTTAITEIANSLRNNGYNVIIVPEAASLIFSSGADLDLQNYTLYEAVEFQKNLMEIQLVLENRFNKILNVKKSDSSPKTAIIFDRGLLDGSAYVDAEQWEVIMAENGLSEFEILKRYDIVIHMVTAADGAEEHYQTFNNEARSEDMKSAVLLDRKLQKAYCAHPCQITIGNQEVANFREKIQSVENFILQRLNIQPYNNYHRKYLVRDPKGELFRYLAENHTTANFTLVDIFISQSEGGEKVSYLRKRVIF